MTERFLSRHSEYSNHIVTVSKAFQGVTTELCAGMPPSVRVRTETSDLGLSREVVGCFADAIIGYFKDENHGLFEKMSAWFEGQKAGKGLDEVKKSTIKSALRLKMQKENPCRCCCQRMVMMQLSDRDGGWPRRRLVSICKFFRSNCEVNIWKSVNHSWNMLAAESCA